MLRNRNWIVLLVLLAAAAPMRAQNAANSRGTGDEPASSHVAATTDASYLIGAQDVLDIDVWKQKELTRAVEVRPDGKISLPLLNDVQASGLTPMQLAANITDGLKKFITDPQVTVIVTQINSQRVYILGEVTKPGAYPLLPGMNVLQALSSAGGFTMFANTKKIYVLRKQAGKQKKFAFNYKAVISGKHTDENIVLRAGDQIVVP
ncbi:MAG TPA: polysaccharide biosynthesis/export family protein [Candidatus Dormibacteraeota bacterium]|nr:polysaccharide biosynthesis/export family protein [Candidatus Dormibacteraeota bacterium]